MSCSLSLVRKIVLKSENVGIGAFHFMRSIRCLVGDGAEVFVFGPELRIKVQLRHLSQFVHLREVVVMSCCLMVIGLNSLVVCFTPLAGWVSIF